MIEVVLNSVRVNEEEAKYVLLLQEREGTRVLGLWVGQPDADAARRVLLSQPVSRPQPHELMLEAVNQLGGKCLHAVITKLVNRIYYAKLVLEQNGRQLELDSRPSDAVNVALRAGAPLFADESLLIEWPQTWGAY